MLAIRQSVHKLVEAIPRRRFQHLHRVYQHEDLLLQHNALQHGCTLLCRLAKVTNAVLVSGYCERQADGRYLSKVRGVDEGMYSKNLEESVAAMNKTIENNIREAPAQNLWTYKRFRLGPEGKRRIY